MKIFISWSGPRSRAVAQVMRQWLSDVFQQAEPWMSEHDVDAGSRWSHQLSGMLEQCQLGIICVTPENQEAPWLLFEAGCLAKAVQTSRVIPYIVGMGPSEVKYPLAQFQAAEATESGTLKLLKSINEAGDARISDERLVRVFEKWWPDLRSALSVIPTPIGPAVPTRTDHDVLQEMLGLLRATVRRDFDDDQFISIDSRSFFPKRGIINRRRYKASESVSDFLDSIWGFLNRPGHRAAHVPAFTYGTEWLLQDERSRRIYSELGLEYCKSGGRIRDERLLEVVGIRPGDRLRVIRPEQPNNALEPSAQ